MSGDILSHISCPIDLKTLDQDELKQLAAEIREKIIDTTSQTGGHLAPSLGVVELTLGIHRALNCPDDTIVFDVGHQAYAHKLLTGRCSRFDSLRTMDGISGFTKRLESEYDAHDSGHASDSVSIALGLALARDAQGGDSEIVAVIGDGAMTGGMSFEALNYLGHIKADVTVVLNDNEMSIAPNVGAIAGYLGRIRLDPRYVKLRDAVETRVTSSGKFGRFMMSAGEAAKDSFKQLLIPGMLFEEMGLKYVGPIDGHDIFAVQQAIENAKNFSGPVIIHAITRKGAGYLPAETHPDAFHGVGPFDKETGKIRSGSSAVNYTKVFANALVEEARNDRRIVAITAAMPAGTGLDVFAQSFPTRTYDVGIAEGHAVGMAAGLALGGQVPVVAVYSTFLQRAYDQMIVNVALEDLHVVFCLDRAGLVGEDGPTHHGVFDLAYLRAIPNMDILAPSSAIELADALHTALALEGPVAIRYPRGSAQGASPDTQPRTMWDRPQSVLRREGTDMEIFAVGSMVSRCLIAAELLEADGLSVAVRDMRWVKPLDEAAVRAAADAGRLIATAEEGTECGGFGDAVLSVLATAGERVAVCKVALPDAFVPQGTIDQLLHKEGLDADGIRSRLLSFYRTNAT